MKLPAIDLHGTLGKVPGLSKFIKPKAGPSSSGSSRGKAAPAKSHEQEVQQRLDLTTKGLGGLATLLVLFALYSVFAQSGLNKAIHTAAPPMVDLSELVPSAGGKAGHGGKDGHGGKEDHAKEAKAANNAKLKLPEGTDPRIDYAFEQIANFENTRSEAVLRNTQATVAGVAPGSVAARSGFRVGDFILSIDGEQAGFVWDSLRKLTAAGKSSVLLEVQRGNEVLRGELMAPEGELLTSSNTGLFFEIPDGYRFIGENDRRELRNGFSRAYMEGLAGDERLAYATSLALLGGNLVKRGVEQADLKPSDAMWLKTEQILGDHHGKFSKALAHHGVVLESMQANLQAGFVKIGALLLAALIAGIAALAAALQLNKHLSEQGLGALRAQFQGLRAQVDQLAHTSAVQNAVGSLRNDPSIGRSETIGSARTSMRQGLKSMQNSDVAPTRDPREGNASFAHLTGSSSLSLAELAAKVALSSDSEDSNGNSDSIPEHKGSEFDGVATKGPDSESIDASDSQSGPPHDGERLEQIKAPLELGTQDPDETKEKGSPDDESVATEKPVLESQGENISEIRENTADGMTPTEKVRVIESSDVDDLAETRKEEAKAIAGEGGQPNEALNAKQESARG